MKTILKCNGCGGSEILMGGNNFPICPFCKVGQFTVIMVPGDNFFKLTNEMKKGKT